MRFCPEVSPKKKCLAHHALAGVPVQEGLAAEHAGELLGNTFLPHYKKSNPICLFRFTKERLLQDPRSLVPGLQSQLVRSLETT